MRSRLLVLGLVPLVLLPGAQKKVATAHGENEDLALTVTLHLDPADIKQMVGNDLGGHYIVAEVKVEPRFGKDVTLDRDDFELRTDKDGEKSHPFAASEIAGNDVLVIGQTTFTSGPGYDAGTIYTGPEGHPGAAAKATGKESPLEKTLAAKILPEGKTTQPVSGLLYFALEKQKMKDLELDYGSKDNSISLRFNSKK